jgi:holo-[acyl-carrier protein] synthase
MRVHSLTLIPEPRTLNPEPFPMPNIIGIGTDIMECLRIARMIERHGDLFINRVYTAEEIRYCQNRKQAPQHFPGRWAAKEAILKALGTGWRRGISWCDVEVRSEPGGQPVVAVRGGVKEVVERLGVAKILVSISHCHTHAVAYAIALGKDEKE